MVRFVFDMDQPHVSIGLLTAQSIWMMPRRKDTVTAAVRSVTLSFAKIDFA
jgi:hypothetical protein